MALPSRSRNATIQGPRGLLAGHQKGLEVRACLWSSELLPLIARPALLCVAASVWSALSESRSIFISAPCPSHLNRTHPTLRASLVGLIHPQRGWYWCNANHFSAAVLISELDQHHFRKAPPDSAGPAVFEDQTAWRPVRDPSRRRHAPSIFCRLDLSLRPMSTLRRQRRTSSTSFAC
jgi:hypothetical protein